MAKPVIFVIGASGNVGTATVSVLASKYADKLEIRAGVRNPDIASNLQSLSKIVSIVKAEMGSSELETTLRGVDSLFIVTPSTQNRCELAISTAKTAKKVGVKHIVLITVPAVIRQQTIIGSMYGQLDSEISALGVSYTLLSLPYFFENLLVYGPSIKANGVLSAPVDPSKLVYSVAVADVGRAAAAILAKPDNHINKTYQVISDRYRYGDIAVALEEVLGKKITYNKISYDETQKMFTSMSLADWQAEALVDFLKFLNADDSEISPANAEDYSKITGEKPTPLKTWVSQVKHVFDN